MQKKILSIVLPAYQEEKNISIVYKSIKSVLENLKKYDYEIIFVDDASRDNTWLEILKLKKIDKKVGGITLSKNFGHQGALTAGYEASKGDIIVSIDSDMQHPPELIIDMIKIYEKGFDIVFAKPKKQKIGIFKKYTAKIYYAFYSMLAGDKMKDYVGDYRLVSRVVLDEFLKLREKDRYIRGMFGRLGFKDSFVEYNVPKRIYGKSSYTILKMLKLAMDGILSFSMLPLKIGLFLGIIMVFMSCSFSAYMFLDYILNQVPYPLFKWLISFMFGFMGLQFIFMWIIGEYIGRVYNETRSRPIYIIKDKF